MTQTQSDAANRLVIDNFAEETEYLSKQFLTTEVIPLDAPVVGTAMFFVPD